MSVNSLVLWTIAGVFALSAAMMLVPPDPPVASLDSVLGPEVSTETL